MTIRDDIAKLNHLTGLGVTEQTWPTQRYTKGDQFDNDSDFSVLVVKISENRTNIINLCLWEDIDHGDWSIDGPKFSAVAIVTIQNNCAKARLYRNGNVDVGGTIGQRVNAASVLKRIGELGFIPDPQRNDPPKQLFNPTLMH